MTSQKLLGSLDGPRRGPIKHFAILHFTEISLPIGCTARLAEWISLVPETERPNEKRSQKLRKWLPPTARSHCHKHTFPRTFMIFTRSRLLVFYDTTLLFRLLCRHLRFFSRQHHLQVRYQGPLAINTSTFHLFKTFSFLTPSVNMSTCVGSIYSIYAVPTHTKEILLKLLSSRRELVSFVN